MLLALTCGAKFCVFHDTSPNHKPFNRADGSGSSVRRLLIECDKDPVFKVTDIESMCGMGLVELA
jgi:hypothetical protein